MEIKIIGEDRLGRTLYDIGIRDGCDCVVPCTKSSEESDNAPGV